METVSHIPEVKGRWDTASTLLFYPLAPGFVPPHNRHAMKILYICGDMGVEISGRKGASTHVRETCHALMRRGHEVLLVTPAPGDVSQLKVPIHAVTPPRSRWLGFDLRYVLLNRRIGRAVAALIRSYRPDVVYERYSLYQDAGLRICDRMGIPRILEVNTFLAREQSGRLHFPRLAEMVERTLWRRERAIITVSQTLKTMMIRDVGLREEAMAGFVVMPVAVDPEFFRPDVAPAEAPLRFAAGRKLVGYAGTLTAWHGVDLFFEAARILRDEGHPVVLYCVGGPEPRAERFRERARAENLESHLCFPGSIPFSEIPATLAAMDVCLIPDTQDWSSPTKFFEFAAMERPIVGSRSPSTVEVFGPPPHQAGLLFERGSARDMVDQILRVVNDPGLARRLGQAARRRVLEHYTWDVSVRKIEELYRAMGAPV